MVRLHLYAVGAASLTVTLVPVDPIAGVVRCTLGVADGCKILVHRCVIRSDRSRDRVVHGLAFADAVAPIAPQPFVPVVSTFEKLTTVIEPAAARESVAVTLAPVRIAGAPRQAGWVWRGIRSYCGARISQIVKLYRSPVGAVSLRVTLVPVDAIAVVVRCTQ
jgi:hypothetical protein